MRVWKITTPVSIECWSAEPDTEGIVSKARLKKGKQRGLIAMNKMKSKRVNT